MGSNVAKDAGERADTESSVRGNRDVVFAAFVGQAHVASRLPRHFVTEDSQGPREFGTG